MSSPFSSLKKGGRFSYLPGHIPGHRPIPFRHPEYSEDESKLLEEITTSMAASRLKARDPFNGGLPRMDPSPNPSLLIPLGKEGSNLPESENHSPPTDNELMSLMMARLTLMEQKIQQQEKDIVTKNRHIMDLENRLQIISRARDVNSESVKGENSNNNERIQELENYCLLLQKQVYDMEAFLADYGMIWVGEEDDADNDIDINFGKDEIPPKDEPFKYTGPPTHVGKSRAPHFPEKAFIINFDLLMANIRDLNVLAGEDEAKVFHTVDGARLRRQDPIPLTFFNNGLIMFDGPFRSYTDPTTVQMVQDFLDGYFPSELQARYPEGVPFNVKDMRSVFFQPKQATDVFSGTGMTLGGDEQPSRLICPDKQTNALVSESEASSSSYNAGVTEVTSKHPNTPMSVERFLNKLPKAIIKNGKVIDIRDSIEKTMKGQASTSSESEVSNVSVVQTSVTKSIQKALALSKSERPKTPRDTTTLRIKSENSGHTYIVKMRFHETIGDLRQYLNKHREGESTEYEIFSTYPRKQFSDNKATMESCGLVPNGSYSAIYLYSFGGKHHFVTNNITYKQIKYLSFKYYH